MRTFVIHPYLKRDKTQKRTPEARLEEAVRLTEAIALDIVESFLVPLSAYRPATLIGPGKADEIGQFIEEQEVGLLVVDHALTPIQQRNLERICKCKVIDRTALILEIFGARARTHEGKLQVELAALEYQKSRLVRSWTHLERQRGGFGFLGGPGESQIEIDRRLIRDRIAKIKKELENVVRTRELHRKNRREIPYPIVALVGYTNAGKSTLFNRLTGADVMAMDKLFATLDTTLRKIKLPSGLEVILSDTVGFISDLPHELVASFRATLEEVVEADLLLHVRDISHPDTEEQKSDVTKVLKSLLTEEAIVNNVIEVWNKSDQLTHEIADNLHGIAVSALHGTGLVVLLQRIDDVMKQVNMSVLHAEIPAGDGKALAWLHQHGTVLSQEENNGILSVSASLNQENRMRWDKLYPSDAMS